MATGPIGLLIEKSVDSKTALVVRTKVSVPIKYVTFRLCVAVRVVRALSIAEDDLRDRTPFIGLRDHKIERKSSVNFLYG